MNPQTAYGIISLVVALLSVDYFTQHPIDVKAVKRILSDINHWVRNEDGENLTAYLILSFALVVFVSWGISLL